MRANRFFQTFLLIALLLAGMAATCSRCSAQNQMAYMLLEGSILVDDCIICGRPPIIVPMRGTFILTLRDENPLFAIYDVRDVKFHCSNDFSKYDVTGEGTYEIGGEVALVQRMQLKVQVNDVPGVELASDLGPLGRYWPMIEIDVAEKQDPPRNPLQVFSMHIIAAPAREIWFSTGIGFTSGSLNDRVSDGDLLTMNGHVIYSNAHLVGRLGIMPMVPDLGLDAVDIGAGGEVFFSCEDGAFSETLGPLQHGDLLSNKGRIVATNQQLTSAFIPEPPAPDVGLDAVQVKEDGEILFSIEQPLFSEALGVMLNPGDLLSSKGAVVRTNKELLVKFAPEDPKHDMGLDALYVWQNGEIWFSTELGFMSRYGTISDGDLLSDNGSIVFKNLELLRAFQPLEKLANFGLDALFVVTDSLLPKPMPQVTMTMEENAGDVWMEWKSDGRVFQLERADEPGGPYVPLGPITPEATYLDTAALNSLKSFYRLRLW